MTKRGDVIDDNTRRDAADRLIVDAIARAECAGDEPGAASLRFDRLALALEGFRLGNGPLARKAVTGG